jgi:hypothetical protein
VQTLSSHPFPDIRDIAPDVPDKLAIIIRRMCVKEYDRRIPTPAALIKEFAKIGYQLKGRQGADVKFSHQADSAPTLISMRSLIDKGEAAAKEHNDTLSYETKDVEIQDFITKIKRRKKMRKIASNAAIAAGLVLGVLLIAWLLGVL